MFCQNYSTSGPQMNHRRKPDTPIPALRQPSEKCASQTTCRHSVSDKIALQVKVQTHANGCIKGVVGAAVESAVALPEQIPPHGALSKPSALGTNHPCLGRWYGWPAQASEYVFTQIRLLSSKSADGSARDLGQGGPAPGRGARHLALPRPRPPPACSQRSPNLRDWVLRWYFLNKFPNVRHK